MIKLNDVSKVIKGRRILSEINLEINQGDVVALVGPNGAGKSTLIDLLLDNKKVSSGTIEGQELIRNHNQTGVLYQQSYFTPHMQTYQIIELFRNLYSEPLSIEAIKSMTLFDETLMKTEADKLSGGQKRILDVALTLMGDPDFIILDEATTGMDTSTRKRFYELIQQLKSEGKTILFTSHYIEEVESLADRIVLLHKGEVIRDSTPRAIRSENMTKQVMLPVHFEYLLDELRPFSRHIKVDKQYMTIETLHIDQLINVLQHHQVSLQNIEISNESLLDSIFKAVEEDSHETV
ncbi:ABC transporter ATP-binding protein [Macrococcus lamae]|nr:ABC transporter ATP-binding protein [Macrococcus lamae]